MTNLERIQKAPSSSAVALIVLEPYFKDKDLGLSAAQKRKLIRKVMSWLESEVEDE